MYWSDKQYGGVCFPGIGRIMTRARYEAIRRCLTITDRTTLRPKSEYDT